MNSYFFLILSFSVFISCVLALIIHRFLSICFIKYLTILFIILFIIILVFFIVTKHYNKATNQQFELIEVYEKTEVTAKDVLKLANFTKLFIENGYGGLLRKYDQIDIKNILPNKILSQLETGSVFWTFEFYPKSIVFYNHNLTFNGNIGKSNTIYFSFIPNKIAEETKIMFCSTIENKKTK